jgi:hypothetical protein
MVMTGGWFVQNSCGIELKYIGKAYTSTSEPKSNGGHALLELEELLEELDEDELLDELLEELDEELLDELEYDELLELDDELLELDDELLELDDELLELDDELLDEL